jgi:hypothetical protein
MRFVVPLLAGVVCTTPAAAQRAVTVSAGVLSSTALLNDGVAHTTLRPALAPTVGITLALPTGKGPYQLALSAHYTRSTLNARPTGGPNDGLFSLATIDALVMLQGPFFAGLRWQVGGGAILYRPSESQSAFVDGGVQRWLVAAGAVWQHALAPRLNLVVDGRVDAHTFTTGILVARGYAGSQGVRRFALQVGVERLF